MTERRYQMHRIAAGDYLQLSNDGRTLWRIHTYQEHGDAEWFDGQRWRPVRGTFWGAWRYNGASPDGLEAEHLTEWEHWEMWSSNHRTRGEAIAHALGG